MIIKQFIIPDKADQMELRVADEHIEIRWLDDHGKLFDTATPLIWITAVIKLRIG